MIFKRFNMDNFILSWLGYCVGFCFGYSFVMVIYNEWNFIPIMGMSTIAWAIIMAHGKKIKLER